MFAIRSEVFRCFLFECSHNLRTCSPLVYLCIFVCERVVNRFDTMGTGFRNSAKLKLLRVYFVNCVLVNSNT